MSRARISLTLLLSSYALAAVACADGGPTAPVAQQRASLFADRSDELALPQDDSLTAELERARERLKQKENDSQAAYIAAKVAWKAFETEWKARRKDGEDVQAELLRCEPLKFQAEARIIGPEGGEIRMGPHTLRIPKGALAQPVVITGEAPTSEKVEVTFAPHGLVFLEQPELTLSYQHCLQPEDYTQEVVYVGEGETILEFPTSLDQKESDEVRAWLQHFSNYAVAYRGSTLLR